MDFILRDKGQTLNGFYIKRSDSEWILYQEIRGRL